MSELRVVFVTAPLADAERIVETLVRERLVACGNIVPGVRSIYVWKHEIVRDEEAIVLMETAADRLGALTERIRALHPYECPKIVAFDPAAVTGDYLAWVLAAVSP
ncbi:MAG: divalent-cation tolerance protein CutA [Deltaproteobacteria bacterium]|nr:divalent-cation tolerance protein CutA [Nannocystaceae bacterium]